MFVFTNFLCFRKRDAGGAAASPPDKTKFAIPMLNVVDVAPSPGLFPFGAILVYIQGVQHPWLFSFFTARDDALTHIRGALAAAGAGTTRSGSNRRSSVGSSGSSGCWESSEVAAADSAAGDAAAVEAAAVEAAAVEAAAAAVEAAAAARVVAVAAAREAAVVAAAAAAAAMTRWQETSDQVIRDAEAAAAAEPEPESELEPEPEVSPVAGPSHESLVSIQVTLFKYESIIGLLHGNIFERWVIAHKLFSTSMIIALPSRRRST
jgi:hypothetical protein